MTCPNCGVSTPGPYCHNCGQPEVARLTLRGFAAHLSSRVFSLDRGFLRTLVALFRNPGLVSREFIDGRRIWYTNPLTYWFIAATLQLLALWSVNDIYLGYLTNTMQTSMEMQGQGEEALEIYRQGLGVEDPVPVLAEILMRALRTAYSYMGVVFAFALAGFMRLFVTPGDRDMNLAEHLVFALYIVGHWALFTAVIMPITMRVSFVLHGFVGTVGYIAIAAWASVDFHRAGRRGSVMTALSMVAGLMVFMVIMLLVMFAFLLSAMDFSAIQLPA